jgi:hypothetical protein
MKITEPRMRKLEDKIGLLKPRMLKAKEMEEDINKGFLDLAKHLFKDIQEGQRKKIFDDEEYLRIFNTYVNEGDDRSIAEEMKKYIEKYIEDHGQCETSHMPPN